MSGRWLGWLALGFWGAWLFALEGAVCARLPGGFPVPDLPLLLLLSLSLAVPRSRARLAALVLAGLEAQFSAVPLVALAAGYLLAVGAGEALRLWLSPDAALTRGLAVGLAGLLLELWLRLCLVRRTALPLEPARDPYDGVLLAALATGLLAALCLPWARGLPGLSLLWRPSGGESWAAAARVR
jgi:hypothetical protein